MRRSDTIDELIDQVVSQRRLDGRCESRCNGYAAAGRVLVAQYELVVGNCTFSKEALRQTIEILHGMRERDRISKEKFKSIRRLAADVEDMFDYGMIADSRKSVLPVWGQPRNPFTRPVSEEVKLDMNNVIGLSLAVTKEMGRCGYGPNTIDVYLEFALPALVRYFEERGTIFYSDDIIDSYLKSLKSLEGTMDRSRHNYLKTAARHVRCMHRGEGLYERKRRGARHRGLTGSFAPIIGEFEEWRRRECGVKESTICHDRHYVTVFLECLRNAGCEDMRELTREHVRSARRSMSEGMDPHYVARMLSPVRAFARFAEATKPEWPTFFAWMGPSPKMRRKIPIPGYSAEQAQKIIDSINVDSKVGKRDRAMLLVAKNLGLRAIDIVALKFSDIDWRANTVKVIQEKTGRPLLLPLDAETGEAIATYILEARGDTDCDAVFALSCAPRTAMTTEALYNVVVKYAKPVCGPDFKGNHGIHAFRRGLGASLVEAEVPAADVAEILGHAGESSIDHYAAVAMERLRICAAPLPATSGKGAGNAD